MNKEIKSKLKKEIHRHLVRNNLEPSFYLAVVEQYENDDCFTNLFYDMENYGYNVNSMTSDNPFEEFIFFVNIYDSNDSFLYQYRLVFGYREIMEGYCCCTESDKGYDYRYGCTGEHCDWDAPFISIEKAYDLGYKEFTGKQKDLWDYKDKFYKIKVDQEEEKRKAKIKDIENQIKMLQEELDKLYEE